MYTNDWATAQAFTARFVLKNNKKNAKTHKFMKKKKKKTQRKVIDIKILT